MDEEGLSIEETNALRAKLGLKPLNVGTGASSSSAAPGTALTTEQQDALAAENYKRKQEEAKQQAQEQATRDRIRRARERAERQRLLVGKTLGEEDDDDEDTMSWIKRTKAAKPAKAAQVKPSQATYTRSELAGLKVGHDLADVQGGEDVIMTLKDGGVLDDEAADELVNVSLAEQEQIKKRRESKKRKSIYAADEEEDVDQATGERKILARYDEDMDGGAPEKEKTSFIINERGETEKVAAKPPMAATRKVESLQTEAVPMDASSDYVQDVKLKKRLKKSKTFRKRDQEKSSIPTFTVIAKDLQADENLNFVDDDDLQASLAQRRRLALQRRANPDDLVARLAASSSVPEPTGPVGLVLDDSSELTRSLLDIRLPESKTEAASPQAPLVQTVEDVDMKEASVVAAACEPIGSGIAEEATLNQGVGAAMKLLLEKGVISRNEEEQKLQHEKETWLAQDRKIRLELELERKHAKDEIRKSGAWEKMSQREREAWAASENRRIEALEARMAQDRFKHYKPKVELKYVDDFGRNMSQKEAFKHLSHQFHGKDSGSGKTAKKLAKIEKEKLAERRTIFR
ncbi:SART-1 protein [Protomyces lactucae-debilis]|uniref:SART-1 protein n=1 Tax=Protomyces lactucae-debilis TaxID=2754530 RepID=A0A1Y2FSW8_PROLT|nr:SART-1 protein [Protomyces lactucae-debilis]ORY87068.1 SART-1 protein [Protomyces lactucae-debilis]